MQKSLVLLFSLVLIFTLSGCKSSSSPEISETEYTWGEALEKLHDGEVKSVAQLHNLTVNFYLKNGQEFSVKEPAIDVIFDEVKKCGDICATMELITE